MTEDNNKQRPNHMHKLADITSAIVLLSLLLFAGMAIV